MDATTVAIVSLGCKANQYDGNFLGALLEKNGFRLVDFKNSADVYVINSCTVTDGADLDSRNMIHRAHRRNPDALIVVTGCYAQTKPDQVAKVEGVNLVLGNNQKLDLLGYLRQAEKFKNGLHVHVEDIFQQTQLETFGLSSHTHQTRAYVKIQDGCNQFCTFCVIPFARGRNRSVSISRVLQELRDLGERGFREAILTGIHLGTYGQDLSDSVVLEDLLEAIERERPIHRVRVSSIDPEEVSDRMIEIFSGASVLCPHLHVPLQSGDDATLKLMRRRYSVEQFQRLTDRLVEKIPRVCLGSDVIVGFPYEDQERFENTFKLLERSSLHYLHVFPYSPKRGTRAAQMLGQVSHHEKKERASQLRKLSEEKFSRFRESFLGKDVEVILERRVDEAKDGQWNALQEWTGFSENYLPVSVVLSKGFQRQLVSCRLVAQSGGRLAGIAH